MLGVLGKSFEIDDEVMADLRMNEVLIIDVIDLLGLDNFALIEELQGDILASLLILGDFDLSKATLSENSADLVVFKLELLDGLTFSLLHRIFF